jgi:hypothetical protein
MTTSSIIALRTATTDDDAVLRELSALDSARPLEQPAVVALVDGRPVAAASLTDGSVVADPFVPTADVVELLRARVAAAAHADARPRHRRRIQPTRPPRLRAA